MPEKVISIMAGVKREKIRNALGGDVKVARCMPNLPCSIGSGVMGVDLSDFGENKEDVNFVSGVLGCLGTVIAVDESKMDAVTAVSGSGPAYVFMFIDSLAEAGVKLGLTHEEAFVLAVKTVIGSAKMAEMGEISVEELIRRVCSKGGTTIEAVKVLEDGGMRALIADAAAACARRSEELSR